MSTPAEQLKAKHHDAAGHNPTVEEVLDEDDIQHPPPQAIDPYPVDQNTLSDVARGKQKATSATNRPAFNITSEDAFPSLGGGKAPATNATWSRPGATTANGTGKVTNGTQHKPASALGSDQARGPSAGSVKLPGRVVETIQMFPHEMIKRSELKKPVGEVLRDINKKSKANVVARDGRDGIVIFEASGPVEAVRQALKEVVATIGSKQTTKIAIPLSVRPFLIGKQGQTIQALTKRTGARITVPKQDGPVDGDEDDEDATVDVVIEGDTISANMARSEIQKIVDSRSTGANISLRGIAPEFYAHLAGPRQSNIAKLTQGQNLNVQIPTYHTWQSGPPAQAAAHGQPAAFVAQSSLPIRISGDRQAALQAREKIERRVATLQKQLTSHLLNVEQARHQFIVDQDAEKLHQLLEETGCSVVIPPTHEDSEAIYIIGPPDRVDIAAEKIMDLAAAMSVTSIDVARQHAKAPANHAHNLNQYFRERQALADLESQFASRFVLPPSRAAAPTWQIFSNDGRQGIRARTEAMNLINAHPPSRFHTMNVDPFYHSILQKQAPQVRREQGVHLLFPQNDSDSQEVILVFEDVVPPSEYTFPTQTPSAQQIKEHQAAVQAAAKYLNDILGPQQEIVSRHVEAPPKYHDKVQRHVERQHRDLPTNRIPAQILLGQQASKGPTPGFQLRGPLNDVEELNALILAFLEQEEKDELERGFTMSFDYPHKLASHLIGSKGANIKKLQDEFDVEINYTENKVDLKGPKAKCEAAKSHILSSAKKLEDEATHHIKIPQQHHYELKGPKGSQVVRLQDRYNVRINFPRQPQAAADDDDAATEKSFRGPSQAPDVVIIKGPRKGADEAREELLQLLQYVVDNSNVATVTVAAKQIPSLIGAGGRELDALRNETQCRIDMPKKEDVDGSERVEIKLRGTKKQVEDAKKLLLEKAKSFDNTVTETLDVDQKFYKTIIGPSGATLSQIILDAGGPEDRRLANRYVTFSKPGSSETGIKLQGSKPIVEKIKKAILALVTQKEGQETETLDIPQESHRHLIGPGGSIRRKMEEDYNVEINVPRTDTTGPERSRVKVSGKPEDIAKAKTHIESIIKSQASETIQIPIRFHHIISEDGNIFRRLRNDHGISVDHAGKKPPQKDTTSGGPRGRVADGGALPLITDDNPSENAHSWELVEPQAASSGEEGNIPWVLRGNADNMAKARSVIEQKLANASKPVTTGYLILPDPRQNRFVIGPNGATINSIRQQTGVQIQVPKQGSGSEAIEIKGPKDGVERAKDLVLEAIEQGAGSQRRR